jgi:predicted glycoside hydrolase/deacetylase ChbG (UPF0249 family)
MKRVIVNADDLGRTAGINRGIFEAHRRGIVTSASLMVNHPAARDVPALAAESPGLGIGLHVALTGGVPALPRERVRSLVDRNGRLPSRPSGLEDAEPAEVLSEVRAQVKRFREIMGRDPTHLDSHHNVHCLPHVLDAVVTVAWETGRPVRAAAPPVAERLRGEGIPTTDRFVEDFYDRRDPLAALIRILDEIAPGTSELMCHPAVVDEELRASSSYAEPRAAELDALTSREVRQCVQASGIRLIHFGQL